MTAEPETWRLFIAVPVPDDVRAALAASLEPVRRRVHEGRWQSPETWHLTVRFLGETPVAAIPAVEAAVREAAAGLDPFDVEIGDAGSFEPRRGGRIAWVGLSQGNEQLASLARVLAGRLARDDERAVPFHAHLTVAREAPDGLVAALSRVLRAGGLRPGRPRAWQASELVLYRSVLGRGGATHSVLLAAPLGGGGRAAHAGARGASSG